MKDIQPLISVIIPVYNTKDYLPRCIDSVLNQTYTNLEILLINDGSTDGSGDICDKYANEDKRITVIHKKNTGQSDSQNIGLKVIKGDFVSFVDSDDFMMPTMLEVLMQKIQAYDADVGVCSYLRVDEPETNDLGDDIVLTGIEAMSDVFVSGGNINPETWSKLYKKSLFNDICFPAGHTAGDQHTTYKLMYFAKKVVKTKQVLFRYMFRSDSITSVSFKEERLYNLVAGETAIKFVREKQLPLENHALCFHIGLNLYLINQILKDGSGNKWPQVLKDLRKTVLMCSSKDTDRLLAKKRQIGIKLLRLGWWAYKPARKVLMLLGKG